MLYLDQPTSKASINDLPTELISIIGRRLTTEDLFRLRDLNKNFYEAFSYILDERINKKDILAQTIRNHHIPRDLLEDFPLSIMFQFVRLPKKQRQKFLLNMIERYDQKNIRLEYINEIVLILNRLLSENLEKNSLDHLPRFATAMKDEKYQNPSTFDMISLFICEIACIVAVYLLTRTHALACVLDDFKPPSELNSYLMGFDGFLGMLLLVAYESAKTPDSARELEARLVAFVPATAAEQEYIDLVLALRSKSHPIFSKLWNLKARRVVFYAEMILILPALLYSAMMYLSVINVFKCMYDISGMWRENNEDDEFRLDLILSILAFFTPRMIFSDDTILSWLGLDIPCNENFCPKQNIYYSIITTLGLLSTYAVHADYPRLYNHVTDYTRRSVNYLYRRIGTATGLVKEEIPEQPSVSNITPQHS
jgi:hypothetical protein